MDIIRTQNKMLYHGHKFENKIKDWDDSIHLWCKKYHGTAIPSNRNKCVKQRASLRRIKKKKKKTNPDLEWNRF